MIKAKNAVPAIKDKVISSRLALAAMPAIGAAGSLLFRDPAYDYDVVGINTLVTTVTTAVASPFELGWSAYTDSHGTIQPIDANAFLDNAHCLDATGQPFSTGILLAGSEVSIPLVGQVILPAGAALILTGTSTANTGIVAVTVTLRPKEKDRGDGTKRPHFSADSPYASYYK